MKYERFFLVGGAGFIGSHFADALLADPRIARVTLYDNLSSGRAWHYRHHEGDARFQMIRGDVHDTAKLRASMDGHDVVVHLASNPDIARAATEPAIDFDEGTSLTQNVLEAMRQSSAKRILYASGSGVYGDTGDLEVAEDFSPLRPISTYGASKLAGESMISAYVHMFDCTGCAFRFANVVGPRQTHGVGFDFLRKLMHDPSHLSILGDGTQSKSYIHVEDVVGAVLHAHRETATPFEVYNVATGDYITVAEIAALAVDCLDLPAHSVTFDYTGGNRGWKGDVPVVRINTDRIRQLGWNCRRGSREALRTSLLAMLEEARRGQLWGAAHAGT